MQVENENKRVYKCALNVGLSQRPFKLRQAFVDRSQLGDVGPALDQVRKRVIDLAKGIAHLLDHPQSDQTREQGSLNDNSRTIRLPVNVVQDMQKEKRENEKTNKDLSDKFANLPRMIHLDMHINEDGDTLIDIIKNENVDSPDEVFSTQDILKEKMMGIMSVLDERERAIVEDYYGITGTPRTLEDIGSDFSLTKERVRQIKEKALRKLRNECSDLFEYL